MSLEKCKHCSSFVRSDRLQNHVRKQHSDVGQFTTHQTKELNSEVIGKESVKVARVTDDIYQDSDTNQFDIDMSLKSASIKKLLEYLSEDSRKKISILGILNNHILDRAFLEISSFNALKWQKIQMLLTNFRLPVVEFELIKNYKALTFSKTLCKYIEINSDKQDISIHLNNYIEYYFNLSFVVERNKNNSIIDRICCYEIPNFTKALNLLIESEDTTRASELANNLSRYWSLSEKLLSTVEGIYIDKKASNVIVEHNTNRGNQGKSGVFYDDECFWVVFNDKVITTTLSAREGWDYLKKHIAERA